SHPRFFGRPGTPTPPNLLWHSRLACVFFGSTRLPPVMFASVRITGQKLLLHQTRAGDVRLIFAPHARHATLPPRHCVGRWTVGPASFEKEPLAGHCRANRGGGDPPPSTGRRQACLPGSVPGGRESLAKC